MPASRNSPLHKIRINALHPPTSLYYLTDVSDLIIVNAAPSIRVKGSEDPSQFVLNSVQITNLACLTSQNAALQQINQ